MTFQQKKFLEELYQENFNRIMMYIQVRVKEVETAKDIAQDTFYEAVRQIETVMSHEKPAAWLTQVARNKVCAYMRFCQRWLRPLLSLDSELPEAFSAVEEDGYRKIDNGYSDLEKIIQENLTEQERYLLKQIVVNRVGYLRMAKELNISLSMVEKRMAKIRATLLSYYPEFKKKK